MGRAQITAGRVWRCRVQRRHAVEEIRFVHVAHLTRTVFVNVRKDLRVLLAVSDRACRLNDVRTLRVMVPRMLLKLLGEGDWSLKKEGRKEGCSACSSFKAQSELTSLLLPVD